MSHGIGDNTLAVHVGNVEDKQAFGVNSPIFLSSASLLPNPTNKLFYPRYGTMPNAEAVAAKIAALEATEAGVIFSSGMAAIIASILAFASKGDHVLFSRDLYGGTVAFIVEEMPRLGIEYSYADSTEVSAFERAIKANTKILYLETPSNPLLRILDVEALAQLAKKHKLVTIIDNTFASPINQQPVKLGIDIVVHSATKFLNGHSDLQAGAAVGPRSLISKVAHTALIYGGCLNGLDCYLLERGMKTLAIRVKQQNANALGLAEYFAKHKGIQNVHYPGLPSHPQHALAKRQMRGFGAMLSIDLKCSDAQFDVILTRFKLIKVAISLGGVDTTISIPSQSSHAKLTREEREAQGILNTTMRWSVGIEDLEDLVKDAEQALAILV